MLILNSRTHLQDMKFDGDESNAQFTNYVFVRLVGKNITLSRVDFKYCIFDACYLRDCKFVACNFTGCRFLSTNFRGSTFSNCDFAYAVFDKTIIADDILEAECPARENQKASFARALRVNYQQLGEAKSVNKAIQVELEATKIHFYKSWHSEETYYRTKYSGWTRIRFFTRWLSFTFLDRLWGNGESVQKLISSLLALFALMAVYHACQVENPANIYGYLRGLKIAPAVFLGTKTFEGYSLMYTSVIAGLRLVIFAAMTSILFKRFNRR